MDAAFEGFDSPVLHVKVDTMPKQHHPTPEERDERVSLPLDPETAIEAILATGPHSEDEHASNGEEEAR